MAVTVTDNSLSTNARYVVYSGSTVADDAQTILLGIKDALVNLGWTKWDNAGANAVLGTAADAKIIMRKETYDNASSGHYKYMILRLSSTGSAHTLKIAYAADHSNNASYNSWVNIAYNRTSFNDNEGKAITLSFLSGGSIWIFVEDHSIVFKFTGTGFTEATQGSCLYFGEYEKIFGEACDASTGYIHNGVAIDGNDFVTRTGTFGYYNGIWANGSYGGSASGYVGYVNPKLAGTGGGFGSQFALTEYPQAAGSTYTILRAGQANWNAPLASTSATDADGILDYTRAHLGWLGWIGHVAPAHISNLATVIDGSQSQSVPQTDMFTSGYWRYTTTPVEEIAQFLPNPSSPSSIALYEPVISSGTVNYNHLTSSSAHSYDSYSSSSQRRGFAIHGKLLGFRMSAGQPPTESGGYQFLDTGTIPLDADGYYSASGTPTSCWAIPIFNGTRASACIWVKK